MYLVRIAPALVGAAMLMSGAALAQTPAPAPAKAKPAAAAPAPKTAKPPVARTAKSLDCSKQADAKTLHGKARKTFMSTCKKA